MVALPPISGVKYLPSMRTASTAALILVADSTYPREERSKAADRMDAMGFAIPLPSRSGAEPWTLVVSGRTSELANEVSELDRKKQDEVMTFGFVKTDVPQNGAVEREQRRKRRTVHP